MQQQSLPRNCILKAKGTFFDFSTDEDVLNLNKAVMAVIDPVGTLLLLIKMFRKVKEKMTQDFNNSRQRTL